MLKINIKPLSVNNAWQGRRVKTRDYRKFEKDVLMLLRPMEIPEGEIMLVLEWGFKYRS